MLENLDRENLIRLLEKLGSEDDAEVTAAARELHNQVKVAGVSWDEFIAAAEDEDEYEYDDESDGDCEDDEDDDELDDDAPLSANDDTEDDDDLPPLTDEEKKEATSLIDKILDRNVGADTREEMEDYKTDIAEGEFEQMDLKYLRAMNERLSK